MFGSRSTHIFVFLAFLILRIWNNHFGLPYDGIHPTENFSIFQSLQYLSTGNLKPSNFQHPSLYQYLITLISRIIFLSPRHYLYFYLLGRFISCLASFLCVYVLYRLSKKLLRHETFGLLCACFLGFNLLSIKYAHYAVPDSLSLFFIVLSISFSLKILENPSLKNYLLSGLFCGLSLGSKFSGLISLGYLICAHLPFLKIKSAHYKFALSLLALFLAFFIVSPYHILYLKEAMGDYRHYLLEKGYFDAGNFKSYGYFSYPFILLPDNFGILALLFSLLGLGAMFSQDKRKALFLFIPVLVYFLIIGREKGGILQNILPFLPVLSIFAAYFLLWLKENGLKRWLLILLIILAFLPQLAKGIIFDSSLLRKDTRILAQDWLLRNVDKNAKIAFERYTPFDLNYIGLSAVKKRFNSNYFSPSVSLYPASFYKNDGYDYIVTSNFRRDSYLFFCRNEGLCREADNYSTYDGELELTAEFKPPRIVKFTAVSLPWGTWPHQPVVKIYKVKDK